MTLEEIKELFGETLFMELEEIRDVSYDGEDVLFKFATNTVRMSLKETN